MQPTLGSVMYLRGFSRNRFYDENSVASIGDIGTPGDVLKAVSVCLRKEGTGFKVVGIDRARRVFSDLRRLS
jgi:hypothetical protein